MSAATPARHPGQAVEVVSPASREAWWRIYASDPSGLVTQTPDWVDAMVASGPWVDASRWYVTAAGRELVVPMARRKMTSYAPHWSFGEGWGMGGLLAPGGPTTDDIAAVISDLSSLRAVRIGVRPNPLRADVWAAATIGQGPISIPKRAHVLDLSGGPDVVWTDRYSKNARRDARRAERMGVEVSLDTTGGFIPVFYDLFLKSVARWSERSNEPVRLALFRAKQRDPIEKLYALSRTLGPKMRGYVARVDGSPAAAIIVLMDRNAHYTRGAMDIDVAGKTSANDLLHWTAIQDACAAGGDFYHMGDTGSSASLAHFKEKVGAAGLDYAAYRIERLPITAADRAVRSGIKRVIGFKDA